MTSTLLQFCRRRFWTRCAVAVLGLLAVFHGFVASAQAVPYDKFTTPIGTAENLEIQVSNDGATSEVGEPSHWEGQAARHSLWMTYRSTSDGMLVITKVGGNLLAVLAVYEGKSVDTLTRLARSDSGQVVITNALAGREYDIAIDGYRGAIGDITLRIELVTAPRIVRQPASMLELSVDENGDMTVEALGHRPLGYQWQFQGRTSDGFVDLPGRSTPTLGLRAVKLEDDGWYRLRVWNRYGEVYSEAAEVVVLEPPKLTAHPQDATRTVGGAVLLSASAVGGQPLAWRWQHLTLGGSDFRDLPGPEVQAAMLSLTNLSTDQSGGYRAIVSNGAGSATSQIARLTVLAEPPRIVTQPTNLVVLAGLTASFRVAASGYLPIEFQWSRDGVDLPGQTHAILNLPSTDPSHSGRYSVVVRNRYGSVTSVAATLMVETRPPNDHFENRIDLGRDSTARYTGPNKHATFQPGEPRHNDRLATNSIWVEWTAPGRGTATVTSEGSNFDTVVGVYTGSSVDALTEVASNDNAIGSRSRVVFVTEPDTPYAMAIAGGRSFSGTNAFGNVVLDITYTDLIQPPIPNPMPPPAVQEIGGFAGQGGGCRDIRLSMPTLSLVPVTYEWFRDGVLIPGEHGHSITLRNATVEMSGTYRVEARNDGGVTSASIAVTVIPTPVISIQPRDAIVRVCTDAQFQVIAQSCLPMTYEWQLEGSATAGGNQRVLNLPGVRPDAAGSYRVVVSNINGSVTSRVASLTVDAAPRITRQPVSSVTVKLCETACIDVVADDSCGAANYEWFFRGRGTSEWRKLDGERNRTLCVVGSATTDGEYYTRVSNAYSSVDSRVAKVTVDSLPVVAGTQPTNQIVLRGTEFALQILADDRCGGLEYRWQWRPPFSPTASFIDVSIDERRQLLTQGWLKVFGAMESDSGDYRCLVGNGSMVVTSRVALVTVRGGPSNDHFRSPDVLIGMAPAPMTGDNILATREDGEPTHARRDAMTSVWYLWTAEHPCFVVIETDGSRTLSGAPLDTLLAVYRGTDLQNLSVVAFDDNGGPFGTSHVTFLAGAGEEFRIAVDARDGVWGTIRLRLSTTKIDSAPVIREEPLHQAGTAGSTVTFRAEAYGSPPLHLTWLRNGLPFSGGLHEISPVPGTPGALRATLALPSLNATDEANYSLVVSNHLGTASTRIARLTFGVLIRGQVIDAFTEEGIPDAIVTVGDQSASTDAWGNYTLLVPGPAEATVDFDANTRRAGLGVPIQFVNLSSQGTVQLTAIKTNNLGVDLYVPHKDRHVRVQRGSSVTNSFGMAPIQTGMIAVADWNVPGGTDFDLICVVRGPGVDRMIYFKDRGHSDILPFVNLPLDRRGVFGPETINLQVVLPGFTYHFFVARYVNASGRLPGSGAVFRLYSGPDHVGTRVVPDVGDGDTWEICTVDGDTRNVTWINRLTPGIPDLSEGAFVSSSAATPHSQRPSRLGGRALGSEGAAAGMKASWDFGDGKFSSSFSPSHEYRAPGLYTVSLTMEFQVPEVGGLIMTETKQNFIEIINLPPSARIVAPRSGAVVRSGDALFLEITASDPDSRIDRVEVQEILPGRTNTVAVLRSAPYRLEIPTSLPEGVGQIERRFTALVVDEFGASGQASPVAVSVVDLAGEVLILGHLPDPRADAWKELLESFDLLRNPDEWRFQPPKVRLLDTRGLNSELVAGFQLVLWIAPPASAKGMDDNLAAILDHSWRQGTPIYLIGRDLPSQVQFLAASGRDAWDRLTGLAVSGHRLDAPDVVPLPPEGRPYELFVGPAGYVDRFGLPWPVEAFELSAHGRSRFETRAATDPGDLPVLLRFPRVEDVAPFEGRLVLQAFELDSGTDLGSVEQRRRLALNASAWLLGRDCDNFIATLDCSSNPTEVTVGDSFTLTATVSNNGRCDAGGIIVSNLVPVELEILGAECVSDDGSTATCEVRVDGQVVRFGVGRLPASTSFTLTTRVRAIRAGEVDPLFAVRSNGRQSARCDHRMLISGGNGSECPPPRLALAPLAAGLMLIGHGANGCEVLLEESIDLRAWEPTGIHILTGSETILSTVPLSQGTPRFFRLRVR